MRTSFFALLFAFSSTQPLVAQNVPWTVLKSPVNINYNDVFIFDDQSALIVGDSAAIIKTDDGGESWQSQTSPLEQNAFLNDAHFIDNFTGWAVGRNGTVIKTVDGGHSWAQLQTPSIENLVKVFFFDADTGWVCGSQGLYETVDGGLNWSQQLALIELYPAMLGGTFTGVHFFDTNTGIAIGYTKHEDLGPEPFLIFKLVLRTEDGGQTWHAPTWETDHQTGTVGPAYIWDMFFLDDSLGWIVGEYDEASVYSLSKTTDGGKNWLNYAKIPHARSVAFTDANTGWMTGEGPIYKTMDGGLNWDKVYNYGYALQEIEVNSEAIWVVGHQAVILKSDINGSDWQNQGNIHVNYRAVQFIDENTGWAAGNVGVSAGAILKTDDGGISWQPQTISEWPAFYGMQFLNVNTGYAVGGAYDQEAGQENNIILKTIDGGENWFPLAPGVSARFSDLSFVNENLGWVVGSDYNGRAILKTEDGGENWEQQYFSGISPNSLTAVHFADENTGYITGFGGSSPFYTILNTKNGGDTWTAWYKNSEINLRDVHFFDNVHGYVVGAGSGVEKSFLMSTNSGGDSWFYYDNLGTEPQVALNFVQFVNSQQGWVIGDAGKVLQFVSGPQFFNEFDTPASNLNSGSFLDGENGWVVGDGGWILKLHSPSVAYQTWFDGFEDGNADDWTPLTESRWEVVQDGGYHVYALNATDYQPAVDGRLGEYSLVKDRVYDNFEIYCDMKSTENLNSNTYADYALIFGFRDSLNYDYVLFNANASSSSFNKVINGERTKIKELDGFKITSNGFLGCWVKRRSNEITVDISGHPAVHIVDENPSPGYVGVGSVNDAASFDGFSITGQLLDLSIEVVIPDVAIEFGDTLEIPVMVSTQQPLNFSQFVLEYDSSLVQFTGAKPGSDIRDQSIFINEAVFFPPTTAGHFKNILFQLSGSGAYTGENQEILLLQMTSRINADSNSTFVFDTNPDFTFFYTDYGLKIPDEKMSFSAGALTTSPQKFLVSGTVSYLESALPVSESTVSLQLKNETSFDTTDTAGYFQLRTVPADSIIFTIDKHSNFREAITGADALLQLQFLAFLEQLSEPRQLAADINENGKISGADALALLRFLAFFTEPETHAGEWRFLPHQSTIAVENDLEMNFVSWLLGDVNLSWGSIDNGNGNSADKMNVNLLLQTSPIAEFSLQQIATAAHDSFTVPVTFSSDSSFQFLQFTLAYDTTVARFIGAKSGDSLKAMQLLINADPPFSPQHNGTNKNLVVQLSSAENLVTGNNQNIINLRMEATGEAGSNSQVFFERSAIKSSATSVSGIDYFDPDIAFVDGAIQIITTDVVVEESLIPKAYYLSQNFPNPFNPQTVISFDLPKSGFITLKVYNLKGELVKSLVEKHSEAGRFQLKWEGRNSQGIKLSSGLYFYQLKAGNFISTRRMILLK
ncbi:MAG: T9SS C-terminal target domain-containing protein [Calditrichaeota bacterium]|nr:MAG: T9SS C-terminal target domain-containing protein [Calditrichota bacterium]